MKIHVTLQVEGREAAKDTLTIEEQKLGELTEEEIEQAVEIVIRSWMNEKIEIAWETEEEAGE